MRTPPALAPGTGSLEGVDGVRITGDVQLAARALLRGGLVGMPTETVYGLAADADQPDALARVFAVKGRPADHPLIVHVGLDALGAALDGPHAWVREVPAYARRLAEQCWPGPLTLVLPRAARARDEVTGGTDSVGLRCPAHPVAAALLEAVGALGERPAAGLAAPSANRFGRLSPTRPADVLAELGAFLDPARDLVLDGGPSRVGVESTVLDCTGPAPAVLRPGAIGLDDVVRIGGVAPADAPGRGVRAPGTLAAHYAPRATVHLAETPDAARRLVRDLGPGAGLLAPRSMRTPSGAHRVDAPQDAADFARRLYRALREADDAGLADVVVVPPEDGGDLRLAVIDRVRRAAAAAVMADRVPG